MSKLNSGEPAENWNNLRGRSQASLKSCWSLSTRLFLQMLRKSRDVRCFREVKKEKCLGITLTQSARLRWLRLGTSWAKLSSSREMDLLGLQSVTVAQRALCQVLFKRRQRQRSLLSIHLDKSPQE